MIALAFFPFTWMTRVKSYIYLEIANEGRKTYKELKKEVHEGKKPEQCPPKLGHDDQKCRLLLSSPRREAYEKFTPLNGEKRLADIPNTTK